MSGTFQNDLLLPPVQSVTTERRKQCFTAIVAAPVAVFIVFVATVVSLSEAAIAQLDKPEPPARTVIDDDFLLTQIEKLSSDNFISRRLAQSRLTENMDRAIPLLGQRLSVSDVDVSLQIVHMLADASMDVESNSGIQAINLLDNIALEGATARSMAAQQALDSVSDYQNIKSQETLRGFDAFLNTDTVPLNGREQSLHFLRIDDSFTGDADDLNCLRWLKDVQLVWLEGKRIDGNWLQHVAKMKDVPAILITRTSITAEDLKVLSSLEQLKHLEIVYTPLGDQAVDILSALPVWSSMRLFGTRISKTGAEKLRERLDDIDLLFGRGGFLGITTTEDQLIIQKVLPGGAADNAGLQSGDLIVELDNQPLKRFEDLRQLLSNYDAGDELDLVYLRLPNQLGGIPVQPFPNQPQNLPKIEPVKVRVVLGEQ